ncbi:hypothetical protein AAFC00_006041 [Neodothiora populina]|uniref:Major facilitator superfamily (MFS) profile domain-containing protein n=1 Tax=Neodothiora populina TaxID=2781224 RepID=A0ABR3P6R3_9PEZI
MTSIFQDTLFGVCARFVTRGKVLGWQENHDEDLRLRYIYGDEKRSSTSSDELEKGQDHRLIEFLENDPQDPQNWSLRKKIFVTFNICLLTFSIYIGSAIYTSGLMGITQTFGISQTVAILGLTLYVLGYGLGPMIWSPISEIPYFGRSPIYLGTLFVFVFFNFGVVYAQNLGMLLAFRFLTGFFGSPVLATGGASLADMYTPNKRAYPFAFYGVANVMGPTVGPLIGGFAAQYKGWKWPIWELIWLSGFCWVFLFFFFPETSAANILYRRAARLNKLQPQDGPQLKCQAQVEAEKMTPSEGMKMTFVRPFTLTLTEPIVFFLNLYIALVYAVLYCWLESIPIAFTEVHGFSLGITGLCYLGIAVGAVITVPPYCIYNYYFVEHRFNDKLELKPEIRLESALVGCFCLPICLFFFGWTAKENIHYIVPIIATAFFSIGAFLSFSSVLNYLGDAYPDYIASIYAGNDLFRSAFGAGFPLFANQMFTTLGLDWGNSLLGFISIIFIPIIYWLWWKGESIRKRSKRARHDL